MIKTNNENSMERLTYVAPKMKAFEVDARSAILQDSNISGMSVNSNPWQWENDEDE